jgi:hypothetical protein
VRRLGVASAGRQIDHCIEKAGGRYAVGFFLRLPARFPVPSPFNWQQDCIALVSEILIAARKSREFFERGTEPAEIFPRDQASRVGFSLMLSFP